MTKEELAKILNGREYMEEITEEEERQARESGLVVVFGASDDLVEFRGAIYGEAGAYEGGLVSLTKKGLPKNECDDPHCPYFGKLLDAMPDIDVLWDKDGYSWKYKAPFPVAEFDIVENGEKYCRGIVFNLDSLIFPFLVLDLIDSLN
jgi:hypothetical protein